jgi:hypothetical protein
MITSPSKRSRQETCSRFAAFLVGTVIVNLTFLVVCPNFTVPPRLSQQMGTALLTLGLSLVPFFWGFYVLFLYRTFSERIMAYLAIAISLLWVGFATKFVIDVLIGGWPSMSS